MAWLIYLGAAISLVAFAIRDELKLRALIVASTFIYIVYYYLAVSPPLWDSIITSLLLVSVNILVLAQILLERTTFRLSKDEKALFDAFETLTPGQFRKLLKIAKWATAQDPEGTLLTQEDTPSEALIYIFDGIVSVEKKGRRFRLPGGNFVGEVGYVLNRQTTTTSVAPMGVRYVQWDALPLRRLSAKHPNLGNALNALLTRDLARKLSASYQPEDAMPSTNESRELLDSVTD
ncbi:MAG: cyclic nucleotide-binding domain-containing protein [Pseudomonadota bacterium]